MDREKYKIIDIGENPLKIDKDKLEIQNTIIYQGEKIALEIDKLSTIMRTMLQHQDKGKTIIEKTKEENLGNPFIKHLRKLKWDD